MTRTLRTTAFTSLLALLVPASGTVLAQDLRFLAETPYSYFKKEDKALFSKALNETLDKAADGEAKSWSNPNTKAGGELKALKSYEAKGLKCRTLHIANKAQGRANAADYNFCKQASGKWAIAGMAN
jgi:surface antigen